MTAIVGVTMLIRRLVSEIESDDMEGEMTTPKERREKVRTEERKEFEVRMNATWPLEREWCFWREKASDLV